MFVEASPAHGMKMINLDKTDMIFISLDGIYAKVGDRNELLYYCPLCPDCLKACDNDERCQDCTISDHQEDVFKALGEAIASGKPFYKMPRVKIPHRLVKVGDE